MIVDSSDHDPGEKARLQLPTMKENDTHCIDFSYLLYSKSGANPGTLNILVRVNKGPLANPIWNVTGSTGKDWLRAELAVSTFWPNEYQLCSVDHDMTSKTGKEEMLKFCKSFVRNQCPPLQSYSRMYRSLANPKIPSAELY
ncbi:Receptor-type tyrosine-protein phosphatase kappa [Chelonia mydas]|uniref:Receptor-type tyrosine-protein phosphatase kappa n=1 Tax=Chelonia mydas TaxID=8469 RepID=M7BRY3_CHEMY|nr:Receptor-type tyrosine-protein phosphatase kappa [Chelonia mydas]